LNLRQAKHSFPSVHLLVGVFEEAPPHAPAIFSHVERLETVRHIRYVDELVPEAPLQLTEGFIHEWNIDYVAYEEDTAWNDPGYQLARKLGKFLPLRSTGAISTGEVLQRLRGETEQTGRSSFGTPGRQGTILAKAPIPHLNTDFAPLTPASYQEDDSPVAPEPNELLDPFTN
jgi:glycerol-3-phosphate cytidylyltransferase-like family protein